MPRIVDDLIANPEEFAPDLAEYNLSENGISVVKADWGESSVEASLVRQQFGSAVVDRHLPDKEAVLELRVGPEGEDVDLPTAALRLQQLVGTWQQRGGWLQRDFVWEGSGKFAGSLACQVKRVNFSNFGGWGPDSPNVVLGLLLGPVWYATFESESAIFSESSNRALVLELASILGTHPGLIRIQLKNEGEEDWRGLIVAGECWDHPQDESKDTTAALEYMAADLTLKGGSKDVGGGVVEHEALTAGWLSILSSRVDGVGHMTHRGVRRLWLRAEALHDGVQLRLRFRSLGQVQWEEMDIVAPLVVDAYQWLDMGECRIGQASLGDERWEFEILARALSGPGKVRLKEISPLPTEMYAVVRTPYAAPAADAHSQKAPGTVATDDFEGIEWTNVANAKTSDDSWATAETTTGVSWTNYLKATNFGFALPENVTVLGWIAIIERSAGSPLDTIRDNAVSPVKGGEVLWSIDYKAPENWPRAKDEAKVYGSASDLWGTTWTPGEINNSGFGVALSAYTPFGLPATARVDNIRIIVYYTEAADENRVCFAGRSIEIRSDGIYRQHPEDDVWGRLVPDSGFYPRAMPSSLEGLASRFIVIPSQGDLAVLPDSGTNPLEGQAFTCPAYHAAREAHPG